MSEAATDDSTQQDGGPSSKGFSFGFSKTAAKPKFVPKVVEVQEEKDYIKDVKGGRIEGSKVVKEKEELVIPCTGNIIKFPSVKNGEVKKEVKSEIKEEADVEMTEEQRATVELLADAKRWEEDRDNEAAAANGADPNLVVPLKLNPDDKEFLDADVSSRAEAPSLDDYDSIPVEGFGMGMLRGMGFKPDVGVGGFKKAAVACIEPVIRPKGLGLGAARPNQGQKNESSKSGEAEEELILTKNSFVQIERGTHKTQYGQVDGLDDATGRIVVRLAVGGQVISISENIVRVVTKKEFKEFGKMINKDSYEKYREKQREREDEWNRDRGLREANQDRQGDRDGHSGRGRAENDRKKEERRRSRSPKKESDRKTTSNGSSNGSNKRDTRTWLRPFLRVRIVDKKFKNGKYYNTKGVVEDVSSNEFCTVRSDSGSILDGISNSKCETLIPKDNLAVVMIVNGSHRGQLAEILSRDKHSSRAAVRVLPDKEDILKLDYDDICEYAGDISHL